MHCRPAFTAMTDMLAATQDPTSEKCVEEIANMSAHRGYATPTLYRNYICASQPIQMLQCQSPVSH